MAEITPVCQITCVHEEAVAKVQESMLPDEQLSSLSELFKILGDRTRMRILHALSHHELCVCDLVTIIGMSQPAVSHQLRLLRAAKLVRYRKVGKNVYYSLADDHVTVLLSTALEHILEE
ncbi:ArsR/SmtB family transcription factor [Halodesulfovibrio spirochaetisodalis]|uniref:ArsR family transcriptional regulator n=1 Tax=Halodesulfovibrio spirochaetisodalis TaxID=1560234 RepID=A0A1B7XLC2_9BACT|nr:metalloregulator ArsR/SmtB family transcription factor [Halodesulfovibrio spirochaetisodalis]OBQ56291.1 ArsR family transcriptional regulator [Halodesulfovibrio spirochaetisodalis]